MRVRRFLLGTVAMIGWPIALATPAAAAAPVTVTSGSAEAGFAYTVSWTLPVPASTPVHVSVCQAGATSPAQQCHRLTADEIGNPLWTGEAGDGPVAINGGFVFPNGARCSAVRACQVWISADGNDPLVGYGSEPAYLSTPPRNQLVCSFAGFHPTSVVVPSSGTVSFSLLLPSCEPSEPPTTLDDYLQPASGTLTCDPAGACTFVAEPGFVGTVSFVYATSTGATGTPGFPGTIDGFSPVSLQIGGPDPVVPEVPWAILLPLSALVTLALALRRTWAPRTA